MTKRLVLIFFLSCLPLHAATTTISFDPNSSQTCCTTTYRNGEIYKRITNGDTTVITGIPEATTKDVYRVWVGVRRDTNSTVLLDPRLTSVVLSDEASTTVLSADADQMLDKATKHAEHMQRFGAALGAAGASLAQQDATVTNSDGSTSNVSFHDSSADARARDNAAFPASSLQQQYAELHSSILRKNTLEGGETVKGFIYFKKPKHLKGKNIQVAQVNILVDEVEFCFR